MASQSDDARGQLTVCEWKAIFRNRIMTTLVPLRSVQGLIQLDVAGTIDTVSPFWNQLDLIAERAMAKGTSGRSADSVE